MITLLLYPDTFNEKSMILLSKYEAGKNQPSAIVQYTQYMKLL